MQHTITERQESYRESFTKELCDLLGCEPSHLPTTADKDIASQYLGLTNKKTLDVWYCNGRYGIVMIKVGRSTRPCTQWLINTKLAGVRIAEVAS